MGVDHLLIGTDYAHPIGGPDKSAVRQRPETAEEGRRENFLEEYRNYLTYKKIALLRSSLYV
jgi:hypothetical protein